MTPLDKPLKRSLNIAGMDYVVRLSAETLKLTRKGRRLGLELRWAELIGGETALAIALHASVGKFEEPRVDATRKIAAKIKEPKAGRVQPIPLRSKRRVS
jgi:hypothetical protein